MTSAFLSDEYLIEEVPQDEIIINNEVPHSKNSRIKYPVMIDLRMITTKRSGPSGVKTSYDVPELKRICLDMFGTIPTGGKPQIVEFLLRKNNQEAMIENNRLLSEFNKEIRKKREKEERETGKVKQKRITVR